MAEHSELVSEMAIVEKMSTQERLKHAKKRRLQQLKKWSQREKNMNSKKGKTEQNQTRKPRTNTYKVHFVPSVMLLEAAARNDVDEVRRLLMLGVSPDSTNEDGLTALHQCCIDDSEEMMKLLIEFGANVNAKDSEQWTPLHAAATCGHIHLVRYLISKGADLLAVNADGNMPYDICEDETALDYIESEMAKRGITQEMIDETRAANEVMMLNDLRQLVEEGGELEFRDEQGATPLHIAAANGYVSVVEFLLDQHVSTDVSDNDQWQPIHAAACWGHPDVLEMLVLSGADLNARTKNGETPYDICEDPELKARIMQLRDEMETKRATQPNKLKRTQSQNTRSQSVRRTSIREKTQISRREAREEARIRQEKQTQGKEEEDESKQQHDSKEYEKTEANPTPDCNDVLQAPRVEENNLECQPDTNGQINPSFTDTPDSTKIVALKQEDSNKIRSPMDNLGSSTPPPSYSEMAQPLASRGQGEAVKVEIHVTVNTSPSFTPTNATLPDLKKHRLDMRSRGSLTLSSSSSPQEVSKLGQNGHHFSATCTYDSPPSPTASLGKFKSDPTEIVGDNQKQGCCVIM